MTEKSISRRWFDWIFPHITGSEEGQKKNSCAEKISLTLTRREAEDILKLARNGKYLPLQYGCYLPNIETKLEKLLGEK